MSRTNSRPPSPALAKALQNLEQNAPKSRQLFLLNQGKGTVVQQQLKIRKFPVCWGIPMDELCFSLWFSNFMHLSIMPWDNVIVTLSTYLPEARNAIHQAFLHIPDNEYLVMLDSDVMPPPDFLDKLLAHKKPLVGGWYRRKGGKNEPVVYDQVGDQWKIRTEPGKGLEQVDGAGAGVWLMRKDVAQAIGEKPYDMEKAGEDLALCMKVRAAGFPIFVDWSLGCAHAGVAFV